MQCCAVKLECVRVRLGRLGRWAVPACQRDSQLPTPAPPPLSTSTSSRLVPAPSSSSSSSPSPPPLTNRHDSITASKQCIAEPSSGKPSRRASLQPWRTHSTPPPQRRNPPLHSGTGSARIAIPPHPQCSAHPRPTTRPNQLLPTQASAACSDSSSSTRSPVKPPLPPLHPRHSLPSDPAPPPGPRLAPRASRLRPSHPLPLPPPRAKLSTCSPTPTPPNRQKRKRQKGVVACSRTNSANATPTGAPPAPSTSTATRPHSYPMMMTKKKKKMRASPLSPTPIHHPEAHPTPTPSTTPARVSLLPSNRRPPPPFNRDLVVRQTHPQGSRWKTRVPGSSSALCSRIRSCSRARASRPPPASLSSIAPPPPSSALPPAAAAQPPIHHFSHPAHALPPRAPTRLPCMLPTPRLSHRPRLGRRHFLPLPQFAHPLLAPTCLSQHKAATTKAVSTGAPASASFRGLFHASIPTAACLLVSLRRKARSAHRSQQRRRRRLWWPDAAFQELQPRTRSRLGRCTTTPASAATHSTTR